MINPNLYAEKVAETERLSREVHNLKAWAQKLFNSHQLIISGTISGCGCFDKGSCMTCASLHVLGAKIEQEHKAAMS